MAKPWEVLFSGDASARLLTDLVDWTDRAARDARTTSGRTGDVRDDLIARFDLFQVARTLRPEIQARLDAGGTDVDTHAIWLGFPPGLPGEAFAHLLAGAIASQFGEPTVVVRLLPDATHLVLHEDDRATALPRGELGATADAGLIARHVAAFRHGRVPFVHLVYVDPSSGLDPLPRVRGQRFDRVVVIDQIFHHGLGSSLERCLKEVARNTQDPSAPFFCSFVPTVLGATWPRPAACGGGYDVWPARAQGWRAVRDACVLDLRAAHVEQQWQRWRAARSEETFFRFFTHRRHRDLQPTLDRWARATTNRQVGLALSGGGASSYRFVPGLERFLRGDDGDTHRPTVPIDVLSGASGGALLGAYVARHGAAGIGRAVDDGPLLQVAVAGFTVRSQLVGDGAVAELPLRFLPVAVALPDSTPPETRVLTHWPLGEAVRASGSLPIGFAPTRVGNDHYADGSFAAVVPGQVLKDYGADLVLAFNSIPGPALGNPFDGSSLLGFARRWTPLGRLVDGWVALSYLVQESSELVGEAPFVHELVGSAAAEAPLVESILFGDARGIVERARVDETCRAGVERCVALWRDFRSWDAPGAGWSAPARSTERSHRRAPVREPRPEEKTMTDESQILTILSPAQIDFLRKSYDRGQVIQILREVTPRKYRPAHQYFAAVTDTFYPLESNEPGEVRSALNITDRQRCVLALQAGTGQVSPLAIHIYVSLMEGITPAEIANILLLAGVYTGVPNFFTGLHTLETTLETLAGLAAEGISGPLQVLLRIEAQFEPGAPAAAPPGTATVRPAQRRSF